MDELTSLNAAIKLNPENAENYRRRGVYYYYLEIYEKAITDLSKAIELEPSNHIYYYNRGNCYNSLGKYKDALVDHNSAVKLNPNDYISYYNRGNNYKDLEKYKEAVIDYNSSIKLNDSYISSYINRGICFLKLKKYKKAIADLKKSIKLNQNDVNIYKNIGLCYCNLEKYQDAIDNYSKIIELYPLDFESYNDRGLCYIYLEKYNNAIIDYTQSIALNQNNFLAYSGRGICYLNLQKYEKAIIDFNKAIKLNPNHADVYNNRGICYKELEKYEEAIIDYDKAIELNPNHDSAHQNRGICYSDLKKYEEAGINFNNQIKVLDDNDGHLNRGFYYCVVNEYDAAVVDFNRAIMLSKNKINTAIFAKTSFANLKQYGLAREYAEKAFEHADDNEKIHKQVHLDDIRNREELDERNKELEKKNKELELRNQELELQKKETEEANKLKDEKEQEMLSFFTHTMRNALATAPSSLREAIRLLSCDDYETNKKHYNAINKIVTLFSTLSITDCLIDTFKQSISNQKEFTESWDRDSDGEATPKSVIALALRQSLNRIIFSDADKLIMLLDTEEIIVMRSTRKSFIDNVLSLDIDEQSVSKFYDWIDATMNLIEVNIENENAMPNFGSHQVKFSLLFAITSELILNALKYWNGVGKIQIDWKFNEDHYVFTVKNGCEAHAISNLAGSKSGVKFITRLMELLGEQASFNCTNEEQCFVAELVLHKKLFEKLNKHESVMD